MKIRQFDLINSEGEVYTLTVANNYTGFLTTVEGLGYDHSPEYQKVGSEYERLTDGINQKTIAGVIRFSDPYSYQNFSKFALFCQDKDLTLCYRTPTGLFKRNGEVSKIEKSEGGDCLKAKIEFVCSSLWYKEYDLTAANASSISVISDSLIESPCHVLITPSAAITSASWTTYIDEVTDITGALSSIEVGTSETLHIRTDTNPYRIYKSGNTETDLYSKSDFSKKRFMLIKKGVNRITFGFTGNIGIEGKILYETV